MVMTFERALSAYTDTPEDLAERLGETPPTNERFVGRQPWCGRAGCGQHLHPRKDPSTPHAFALPVVTRPGGRVGAVWLYEQDGRRWARLGRPDGDGWHFESLPVVPPSPEWAQAIEQASEWIEES